MSLKLLSLFSGIGAFEKALTNLDIDYELVGFSEIDKWAIESYCAIHNVDKSLNLGDIKDINVEDLPNNIDLITYGFPCQDISVAGKQKGINKNTRSGLLYEAERIIEYVKPKYAIAENVKNLVGKRHKEDFSLLLERLNNYGYNNYWKILNAKDYGIPQNRERVFIVSIRKDIDDGGFEFPKPMELKVFLRDVLDTNIEDKYFLNKEHHQNFAINLQNDTLAHKKAISDGVYKVLGTTLGTKAKGTNSRHWVYDTSKAISTIDATTYKQPKQILVEMQNTSVKPQVIMREIPKINKVRINKVDIKSLQKVLRTAKHKVGYTNKEIATKLGVKLTTVEHWFRTDSSFAIPSEKVWLDLKKLLEIDTQQFDKSIMEFEYKVNEYEQGNRAYSEKGIAPTLTTSGKVNINQQVVSNDIAIRKLTPLECWRLMGFDDGDYWKARKRLERVFYNGNDRSNSQMYKQAGNSIVVNVLEEIFKCLLCDY